MKVLGICCGRKDGNTEIMMKEAFRAIENKCGAQCRLVRLQEAEIKSCIGCEACITNRMKGVKDFRCTHRDDSDHFRFIEELARESDAIIVSSPSYMLMPPGILIRFLDRFHGSGDYEKITAENPKIGATFTLGGSDWNNFTLPMTNKVTAEMVGSFSTIVDICNFSHVPSPGAVVLWEDVMARMRLLGERVGDALLAHKSGKKEVYAGEKGICPDCHGTLLERIGEDWYCPQCMTKATLSMEGAKLKVVFTPEERGKNRWSEVGDSVHKAAIGREHQRAAQNWEKIECIRRDYASRNYAVTLPELNEE